MRSARAYRMALAVAIAVFAPACAPSPAQPTAERTAESPSPVQYDAASSGWTTIAQAPLAPREDHVAVWTGSEMIIWGGDALLERQAGDDRKADGYSYDPKTGAKTLLIHEVYRDGSAHDPVADAWRELPPAPIDEGAAQKAVWTGREMLVWMDVSRGRLAGMAYDPKNDSWRLIPAHPYRREYAYATVWTGEEMIIAAGIDYSGNQPPRGAAYNPTSNTWRVLSISPVAPPDWINAVWGGHEMIVWGGGGSCEGCPPWSGGFAYNPSTDKWRKLPTAPIAERAEFEAVWTGDELIVWGGHAGPSAMSDGAAYDAQSDKWRTISDGPLDPRYWASTVWSGKEVLIWGGYNVYAPKGAERVFGDGAAYDPDSDSWRPLPDSPLHPRCGHSAIWAENRMILWGGTAHCGSSGPRDSDGATFTGSP